MIHPTAIIDPRAEIAPDASIGPYSVIEGPVRLAAGVKVYGHVYILGRTEIGAGCEIHPFAVVGGTPQDFHYTDGDTGVVIGPGTLIREHASISRGCETPNTIVGGGCMIMAKAHVGHDCVIDDGVVLTNGAECAGHVHIGAGAVISGHVMIHQFVRIGRRAMCVGAALVKHDVPPFMVTDHDGGIAKINLVGLRREGFSRQTIAAVKGVFKALYRSDRPFATALAELRRQEHCPSAREILDFVSESSKRGIAGRSRRVRAGADDSDEAAE